MRHGNVTFFYSNQEFIWSFAVSGAVAGVGLAHGFPGVDFRVFGKIVTSWLLTVPKVVRRIRAQIFRDLFSQDREFKATFQPLHFFRHIHEMSHNADHCADMLRAMIAR